ncbi:hypothetical protein DOY81_013200, partial [Sarcophaga bullata]
DINMKPCIVKAKRKENPGKRPKMNPGDTITTTEINTEIKVEVQLETASIVKVETIKRIENIDSSPKLAIEKPLAAYQESAIEKTREQIKAEREAKKLAKQSKKQNKGAGVNSTETNSIPNTKTNGFNPKTVSEKIVNKLRLNVKAKKLAQKQAAKAAKAGANAATVALLLINLTPASLN